MKPRTFTRRAPQVREAAPVVMPPRRPTSADLLQRRVEAIVSTFAEARGHALDPQGCDLSRLIGGPVLDAHRTISTRDILGVVERARIVPEGLWAQMRFRDTDAAMAVLTSIQDGILRGVSLGYSVQRWGQQRQGNRTRRIALRWTPLEVSVVPLPADAGATFRSRG